MVVYVVFRSGGDRNDSEEVIGVFSTVEKAKASVTDEMWGPLQTDPLVVSTHGRFIIQAYTLDEAGQ